MKLTLASSAILALLSHSTLAFAPSSSISTQPFTTFELHSTAVDQEAEVAANSSSNLDLERQRRKQALLGLIGGRITSVVDNEDIGTPSLSYDPVLADPLTKNPLSISITGPILGGSATSKGTRITLRSSPESDRVFAGRTNAYINLLEPATSNSSSESPEEEDGTTKNSVAESPLVSSLLTLTPPGLRSAISNINSSMGIEYIPMRDLFTSPSVSFAYERGWRQGFAAGGFPGVEKEFEMAQEYFAPVLEKRTGTGKGSTLVDMSCATGLFTRRFAKSNDYSRVIGCDYSDSMLTEARRRIRTDPELTPPPGSKSNSIATSTRLDLVRCDVANVPMQTESIDALHAGAAMHCWPEMEPSLKEIYRVLIPGGRYFATTFLGNYFQRIASIEKSSGGTEPNMQSFQYFPDVDYLRDLMVNAGFDNDKIDIETVGSSCVIIRCEK